MRPCADTTEQKGRDADMRFKLLPIFAALLLLCGCGGARTLADVSGCGQWDRVQIIEWYEHGGSAGTQLPADNLSPDTLRELLGRYVGRSIDSVVLGCTHYPFLAGAIQRMFPEAELFDGRTGTCMRLKHLLEAGGLRSKGTEGSVEFLTSGDASTIALMRRLMAEMD